MVWCPCHGEWVTLLVASAAVPSNAPRLPRESARAGGQLAGTIRAHEGRRGAIAWGRCRASPSVLIAVATLQVLLCELLQPLGAW
jgi:hypothetical protein